MFTNKLARRMLAAPYMLSHVSPNADAYVRHTYYADAIRATSIDLGNTKITINFPTFLPFLFHITYQCVATIKNNM